MLGDEILLILWSTYKMHVQLIVVYDNMDFKYWASLTCSRFVGSCNFIVTCLIILENSDISLVDEFGGMVLQEE